MSPFLDRKYKEWWPQICECFSSITETPQVLTCEFLAFMFFYQLNSLSFGCPREVKLHKWLNSFCTRMRQSKDCAVLQFRSRFSCPWTILAGDKEVSKPQFYFCPDQWLVVRPFTSHLTSLSLSAKWAWKTLPPACVQQWLSQGRWVQLSDRLACLWHFARPPSIQ